MTECAHCPHESEISVLRAETEGVRALLARMEGKIDALNNQLVDLARLEVKHAQVDQALGRAFERVEKLEEQVTILAGKFDNAIAHFRGATRMAMVIWGLLGSGLGIALMRLLK